MSGIRTGTRLEQLLALHVRVRHESTAAYQRADRRELARLDGLRDQVEAQIRAEGGTVPYAPRPGQGIPRGRRQKSEDRVTKRLTQLGVTSHDVKVWAVAQGLLAAVKRGRVKGDLVEAFAAANGGDR